MTARGFPPMVRRIREVRRAMKHLLTTMLITVLATTAAAQERRPESRQDHAGIFDFYVLSLSWSPTFCAGQGGSRNDQQCGTGKDFRFIVHGLWPQYEKGYPDFCETSEPDRVPRELGRPLFDIMPSMGLIGHQWRKHGSCTGLGQRDYFGKLREAWGRIRLPSDLSRGETALTLSAEQIEEKFVIANPGMSRRGISTSCEGKQLEEVRICLTKDLQFRDCAEVDRDGCKIGQITLPAAR
ncbi:ribonuclease T2 family protein [Rhizobium terrae]|uniref:ribonuclease T2 family protein n=1 Tax=Rhizobium terrae TaxID=2171756 RepID=UPI001D0208FE|nr:ribonuclease [Rhizobium terrae]